ncbi:unnamed protein product [Danaus chrysippus]|uniref:(African queen) hypothetical protein n=1 Tax=Danaus chrysippus TaxID=151541 RepID=A0A8J2W9D5_9NEOP|nr:unnamed protein product [Danaus chrysippus]
MLETEEVDIDYFTPASSTSLAKIFSSNEVDSGQDTSLKYVPPVPTHTTTKPEENKPTQCVYASAFHIYEWCNNTHIPKGKLGFAIMKISQTGFHNLVIYNSEKITLSCLVLTSDVTLNIDRDWRISYYDNNKRYWSVCATQPEVNKIIDIVKPLNVQIKNSIQTVEDTPSSVVSEKVEEDSVKNLSQDRESDTDSSIANKRTKETILKRMASMGQSVLPPPQLTFQTSDSSDSNDSMNVPKIRHKPLKLNPKKNIDKKINEEDCKSDTNLSITTMKPITHTDSISHINSQEIVPLTTYNIQTNDLYVSEQRVANTELRMNMNKMGDKLDLILDKVNNLRNMEPLQQSSSTFQNEIVLKLLGEYETKIQRYEEFLKLKGFDCNKFEPSTVSTKEKHVQSPIETNTNSICQDKDDEILHLRAEVQILSTKYEENIEIKNTEVNNMSQEINELKEELLIKDKEIKDLTKKIESFSNLSVVRQALQATQDANERESLSVLQSELQELISLTKESMNVQQSTVNDNNQCENATESNGLDEEYALFMKEMDESDAANVKGKNATEDDKDSDIEVTIFSHFIYYSPLNIYNW